MLIRTSPVATTIALLCARSSRAHAQFQPGDFLTYSQVSWSGPLVPGSGAELIQKKFDLRYPNGYMEVGIPGPAGYSMIFTGPLSVRAFLPASGPYGPLTSDLLDPQTSSAGTFAGVVVALQLNVDFGDAGYLVGAAGLSFGNLRLINMSDVNLHGFTFDYSEYDRLTVRHFLDIVNFRLGRSSADDYDQLGSLTDAVTRAFENGQPSQFAQDHLRIEPPGDFDKDGDADGADFLKWQRARGSADPMVDGNVDGLVDGLDLAIWAGNFGAASSGPSAAVPEPTAWALALLGLVGLVVYKRLIRAIPPNPGPRTAPTRRHVAPAQLNSFAFFLAWRAHTFVSVCGLANRAKASLSQFPHRRGDSTI